MKFSTFDEVSAELSAARFKALEKCVETANEQMCELFVVAGDLFDRQNVSGADIARTASILSGFEGSALLVLPGNHDFYTGTDGRPWGDFKRAMETTPVSLVLLSDARAYDLSHFDLQVRVLPAPCTAKHSDTHTLWWLEDGNPAPAAGKTPLVLGIAHGSVEGRSFDREGCYYPMTHEQLERAGVDVWIIGHSHGAYPAEDATHPRLFIPGTPEPDGFDCGHSGGAWVIECSGDRVEVFKRVETGTFSYFEKEVEIHEAVDLEATIPPLNPDRSLVSLTLKGALAASELKKTAEILNALRDRCFYLRANLENLEHVVSVKTVDEEYTSGSFAHRLLSALIESNDLEAAQLAYRLLQETET